MTQSVLQDRAAPTQIATGIGPRDRRELAQAVSKALAETYVLYLKTQNLHWNVVGPLFYGLHKMSEEQYEDLHGAIDELAERIRALGVPAPATFAEFLEISHVKEARAILSAEQMIDMLLDDHETVARTFRQATRLADQADDVATADMLTDRIAAHEKMAWMLRSMRPEAARVHSDARASH